MSAGQLFPPAPIMTRDKLQCVERELVMRRSVYARWVDAKRMSRDKADREIALMEAIVEDYKKLLAPDAACPTCGGERTSVCLVCL